VAVPWRYQARCPTSSPALASLRRRCPDFPPVPSCSCRAKARPLQSEPAITRPARQFHYSLELPAKKPHPLTKREGLRHPKYSQTCLPPAQYGGSRGVAECTMKINARTLKTEGVRPPPIPQTEVSRSGSEVIRDPDIRCWLGFSTGKTGAPEIVSTMLGMRARLLFHLRIHLRALKESGDAEAKRVEEFHTASGCAASAAPIHCSRSSSIGSIDNARCAGIQVASSPSNNIARTTLANTSGSRGVA
jgi:hypothetical protein